MYGIYVGNKNHRTVFGKSDAIYGYDWIELDLDKDKMKKIQDESTTNTAYSSFRIERTHWRRLNTDQKKCDESMTTASANTTQCIIKYVEDSFGCSMGLNGSNPNIQR